jgi:molecular chaperone Hsp33
MPTVGDAASDLLLRALSRDGSIGVRAISAPGLVAEASTRQGTSPLATAALGRALLGAVLLGAGGKDGEIVQLRMRGDGPLGSVLAIADADARARGRVANPSADRASPDGEPDLPGGIGTGELAVTRIRPGRAHPYTGVVPIVSGAVAKDLTLYLTESEQTPSAVGLGLLPETPTQPGVACGFVMQVLPGAAEDSVLRAERNVGRLESPAELLRSGATLHGLVETLLDGLGVQWLGECVPAFHCGCTLERAVRASALLGREDLDQALREDAPLDVRCDFCGERYSVDPAEALALLEASAPGRAQTAQ